MPTSVGPNTFGEENLVFGYDQANFPYGWGLTQLFPDSEMQANSAQFGIGSSFSSGYYLGQYTSPQMTGNSMIFSGGDTSNYYVSNPTWRGWNAGSIGSTGGNWMYYNILPTSADATRDFIVDCKWRFVYVSATGNGTANPTFQIGRAYTQLYGKTFYNVGSSYGWQYARFRINGADGTQNTSNTFTFGLDSADAAVEIDYMRVYEITKATGLKDLTGNSTIDLTNVSFDSNAQMTFDGTNDTSTVTTSLTFGSSFTMEAVVYRDTATNGDILSSWNNPYRFLWRVDSGGSQVFAWNGGGGSNTVTGTATVSTGTYKHVVVTYDGVSIKLYTNGELTDTFAKSFSLSNITTMQIGSNTYDSVYFDGKIPFLKAYSKPLTASEIKSNFNAIKGRFNI